MANDAELGGSGRKPRRAWWRALLAALSLPVLLFTWICAVPARMFGPRRPVLNFLLWPGLLIVLGILVVSALYGGQRRTVRISAALAALCLVSIVTLECWDYFAIERYERLAYEIDWYRYRPFEENSRVVKVEVGWPYRVIGKPPRIGAAYALYPIAAGVVQALYPPRDYDADELGAVGSDTLYQRLLDGEIEFAVGLPPSAKQSAEAKKRGLAYEVTPFAREAFVFLVNKNNPIAGLTQQQIRDIYSGKITRWEETGSGSGTIKPFQRNEGSGSQTMLRRIMGEVKPMPPLREDRLGGMGDIINDVANYRNYNEALGFSFRFFASEMFRNDKIKFLTIDGVAPTRDNIRNGSYPFVTDVCIITVRPRDENTRKVVEFLLTTPEGRELVEKTGYISLAPAPPGSAAAK